MLVIEGEEQDLWVKDEDDGVDSSTGDYHLDIESLED